MHSDASLSPAPVLGKRDRHPSPIQSMAPYPSLARMPGVHATQPSPPRSAPSRRPAIVEVIDVDDDDAMSELLRRPRSRPEALPPKPATPVLIRQVPRGGVGGDRYVDVGGNMYTMDPGTGKIEISDSPPEMNVTTLVNTPQSASSADWTPRAADASSPFLISDLHSTPGIVERFTNVAPPTRAPSFLDPVERVVPQHSFIQASRVLSAADRPSAPDFGGPAGYAPPPGTGGDFMDKEKLQHLVQANALTADATIEAETPPELNVKLMAHQRRALHWMNEREVKGIATDGEKNTGDEVVSVVGKECFGGILADEQGLGKTLSVLALLLKNRPEPTKHDAEPAWRTLIVCPLSLVGQWKEEIENRIHEDDVPSIHVYHGQKRAKSAEELRQFDVVLTTYATLGKEYPKINKKHKDYEACKENKLELPRRRAGPAFKVKWRRVVLDEAHVVKNRRTDSFNAVAMLKSEYRWCLTGTPIQNSVDDIYALFVFIKYDVSPNYEAWNYSWKRKLENSMAQVREKAFKLFQLVVGAVLLRRTKRDTIDGKPLIELPERNSELLQRTFDDVDEQKFYRSVAEKSVIAVNKYLVAGTLAHNYSSVLLLLLRLRQACCHPFLIEYAGMLNKSRGNTSAAELAGFHSPHSNEELEDALVLVTEDHALLHALDEGVRDTVRLRLAPTQENMVRNLHFGCSSCHSQFEFFRGFSLPCAHFMCRPCRDQSINQRTCMCCSSELSNDPSEVPINLVELRREVHAIVRAGLVQNDNMFELPSSTNLRQILKSRGKTPVKSPKRKRQKQMTLDSFFGKTGGSDDGLDMFIKEARRDGLVDSENGTPKRGRAKEEEDVIDLEDLSDESESGPSSDDDFVPPLTKKKESSILVPDSDEESEDESDTGKPVLELDEIEMVYNAAPKVHSSGQTKSEVKPEAKPEAERGAKAEPMAQLSCSNGPVGTVVAAKPDVKPSNASDENLSVTEKLVRAVSQPSTKIRVLLDNLLETKKRGDNEKTLVFSQWTTMLDIVEFHIEGAGYGVCRLDGSMPMAMRKAQIHEFNKNPEKSVFLISLHAGGTGLNLTTASNVFLLDVWWNPQTEEQAIDRVHRIGQKRTVRVFRFQMMQTVEDRIYDICARKKELSDGMLGIRGAQTLGRKKMSIEEIMFMFGSAAQDLQQSGAAANSEAAEAARNILNFNRNGL